MRINSTDHIQVAVPPNREADAGKMSGSLSERISIGRGVTLRGVAVKKDKSLYWISTGLMAAFMLLASVPDILRIPQAVIFIRHLGYPAYLLPFLGIAKALGVFGVLFPYFRRLKEWAYAGLVFDLIGAVYSHLSVGDAPSAWLVPVVGLFLVIGSYFWYRQTLNYAGESAGNNLVSALRPQPARENL